MKRLIFSITLFYFSIQCVANSAPRYTQVEKPSFITATNDPIDSIITTDNQGVKYKYIYYYDKIGKIKLVLQNIWNGSKWNDYYRYEYSYDSLTNLTGKFIMGWDMFGEQWVNFERYTFTYDADGNRLTDLRETWSGNQWLELRKWTYTYNDSNNLTSYLTTYRGAVGYYYEYFYDSNNNLSLKIEQVGYENSWENHYRYSYSYNSENNLINLLKEEWVSGDSQWQKYQTTNFEYNSGGKIISELLKNWDSFNLLWLNASQLTYTYDENSNLTKKQKKIWYNAEWVNSKRDTYAYNIDSNIQMFLDEYWYNNNWELSGTDFEFDDYYGNFYSFYTARIDIYYGLVLDVERTPQLPIEYSLSQNYPNPFNPTTQISYQIPEKGFVDLAVYDILGKKVATLINMEQNAGNYIVSFNARNLTSGIYFYSLRSRSFNESKKMVVIR